MTLYATIASERATQHVNQRMLDLWNLGAIARRSTLCAEVDRRYHLSDELQATERVLQELNMRRAYDRHAYAEQPSDEIQALRARGYWLRTRLADA